jgi:hypothetical protein
MRTELRFQAHPFLLCVPTVRSIILASAFPRFEEALGRAADFWKTCEYGRFQPSGRRWLGDLVMIEEVPALAA